jgi:4-amino-4-deoxychorismate lyase
VESTLRAGAGDIRLIETLLWDGARAPRLAGHMARMAASAAVFGWCFDERGAEAALLGVAPPMAARLRLTLGPAGDFEATASPLPQTRTPWRLGLAEARLQSDDPWLRHKTTCRAAYDAARAALPMGLDEVLFQNERGELCDGTITTLFFDAGQGMRTPPLACGLLPGVLRAELACPEAVLLARDLPHVRLWVGNALRGLIPAVWGWQG